MTNLREARDTDKLAEFIAEHESDSPGDKREFDATLAAMAGKSKSASGTPKPSRSAD